MKKGYDFEGANWEVSKQKIRDMTDEKLEDGMDTETKATILQDVCRKVCQRYIKRKQIQGQGENDWFDQELKDKNTETRRLRRHWQWEKTEQNRQRFIDSRNEYKKLIKRKKEDHMLTKIDGLVQDKPWYGVSKMVAKKTIFHPKKNYQKGDRQLTHSRTMTRTDTC